MSCHLLWPAMPKSLAGGAANMLACEIMEKLMAFRARREISLREISY